MRDVREVNRGLPADDAALRIARALALMALHHLHALHDDAVLVGHHLQHLALTALVFARQHDDAIALLDPRRHHSTSGARLMIFMKRFACSSRVTGPKIRVPIGSPCLFINTAAFLSKRIAVPSGRWISLAVRTITAVATSPFFT